MLKSGFDDNVYQILVDQHLTILWYILIVFAFHGLWPPASAKSMINSKQSRAGPTFLVSLSLAGSPAHIAHNDSKTSIVQQGTSLSLYLTFPSLNPHYKKDLVSNSIW